MKNTHTETKEITVPKVGTRWFSPRENLYAVVTRVWEEKDSYKVNYRYEDKSQPEYDYCDLPNRFFEIFEPAPKTPKEALNEIRDYISGYSGPLVDHIKKVISEVK